MSNEYDYNTDGIKWLRTYLGDYEEADLELVEYEAIDKGYNPYNNVRGGRNEKENT